MLITETHKNFSCGSKGRLTIKSDSGEVLAVIMTPVQKARKYCEANPESEQGKKFAEVVLGLGAPLSAEAEALVSEVTAAPIPAPPVLTGANPENTALISAQRKLVKLHEAAQSDDPVLALNGIRTSRGNKYLNTCDDYRTALLAHFAEVARG